MVGSKVGAICSVGWWPSGYYTIYTIQYPGWWLKNGGSPKSKKKNIFEILIDTPTELNVYNCSVF